MRLSAIHTGPGGYLILGAWVFAEQIGLPFPATPALLAAGALAAAGRLNVAVVVVTAVAASVLADYLWFRAGALGSDAVNRFLRRHGNSKWLRMAEGLSAQFGTRSLVVAKFVPGLSLLAPPLSGVSGTRTSRFLLFDSLGALAWVGCSIGIGYCFEWRGGGGPFPISAQSCAFLCVAFAVCVAAVQFGGGLGSRLLNRSLVPQTDATLIRTYDEIPDRLTWLANLITGESRHGPDPGFEPLCSQDTAKSILSPMVEGLVSKAGDCKNAR